MILKKLFSVVCMAISLLLGKWFVADFLGYGWAGYGKFCFYFAAICYAVAFVFWLISGVIETL